MNNAARKKTKDMNNPVVNLAYNSKLFSGRAKKGVITPAANHPTAMLARKFEIICL